jgi:hypothetical protein
LAILLDVVHGEMFQGCGEFQIMRIVALQSLDVSHADASGEKRVFPVTLIDAAPVWIAADVDDRRAVNESLVGAGKIWVLMPAVVNRASLVGNCHRLLIYQICVPRRGHRDGDRKHCCRPRPHHAVQTLVPFVRAQADAIDVRTVMVECYAFLLQGQP